MDTFDVAVIVGSESDWEAMRAAVQTLHEFGVSCQARVLSAHRTPAELAEYLRQAEAAGTRVFIAGAGMAAHLAGAIASHTTRPVLAVPLATSPLQGLDALLSSVQMPGGVPVATFAVGQAGAVNAALFAVSLLALERPELNEQLGARRAKKAAEILAIQLK